MASVTYTISLSSGTNTELYAGDTLSGYISRSGGDVPKGAYVTSAELYVSAQKCYTSYGVTLQIGSYGSTSSFAQDSATHGATVSANLSDSILSVNGESITLTTKSSSGSKVMNIRDYASVTLTVYYDIGASGFSPSTASQSASSVAAGGTMYISLSNGDIGSCSHSLYWYCGSYNSTVSVGTGVTSSSFSIPMNWLNAITRSTSGTGYVRVTTYVNGSSAGANTYSFTITVPENVVPTIGSVTASRINNAVPADWGVYVQNRSGVTITANNCAGAYGSTISSYVYSGGANATSSSNSYTVNSIAASGQVSFTVRVTDSRGRSASKSVTISVQEYSTPTMSASAAYRCNSTGEASEEGTYIGAKTDYAYSSCGGKNSATAAVYYSEAGYEDWQSGAENITSGRAYVLGDGSISPTKVYQVKFVVSDAFTTVEKIMDVSTASYTIFFKRGGQAIGLGMESSSGAVNVVEVNPEWEIERNGVKVFDTQAKGLGSDVEIANNLTTTAAGKALDAYQGYVLNNSISSMNSKFNSYFLKSNVIYTTSSTLPAVVNGAILLQKAD